MAEFTPGPWTARRNWKFWEFGPEGSPYTLGDTCASQCLEEHPEYGVPSNEEANARLIAAAPELYEALIALLRTVERLDIREGVCCCGDDMKQHSDPMSSGHTPVDAGEYHHGNAIDAARSAISKAEGRDQ